MLTEPNGPRFHTSLSSESLAPASVGVRRISAPRHFIVFTFSPDIFLGKVQGISAKGLATAHGACSPHSGDPAAASR